MTILSVPHLPQRDQGDCLAACAAMMLYYLGRSVNYNRLLTLLRVRPNIGAPASNIRRLERMGVRVVYEQGTRDVLVQHLANNHPCMTLVQAGELPHWDQPSQHAVVVVGLADDIVYLNDPAFIEAPIQVLWDEFTLAWLEQDEMYAVLMQA